MQHFVSSRLCRKLRVVRPTYVTAATTASSVGAECRDSSLTQRRPLFTLTRSTLPTTCIVRKFGRCHGVPTRYFGDCIKDLVEKVETGASGMIPGKIQASPTAKKTGGPLYDNKPSFKVSRVTYDGKVLERFNMDTSALMQRASIYARDLFFTLNLTSQQERKQRGITERRTVSAILPRKDIIVLSFGKVRAVASLTDVLIFDAHNPAVKDFAAELSSVFKSEEKHGDPDELVFLETVLSDTVESYNRRLRLFEPIVESFLDKVDNNDITSPDAGVHQLVPLKDALQSFEIQVKQSLECLEDLLNRDDDMLSLLLTEQSAASKSGSQVEFSRHEHVELLLGVYARQISNVSMEITYLLQRLQSKQEFVALALSGHRNRMVRMNVHLSVVGVSVGLSTAAAGFFGMNLLHGLESSPTAFGTVILCSTMSSILVCLGCLNLLSGKTTRQRAARRLTEMETLASALSDMGALDHTFKSTVASGVPIDKEVFQETLKKSRQSKHATAEEVDLLFDVFDKIKDGNLTPDDFDEIRKNSLTR